MCINHIFLDIQRVFIIKIALKIKIRVRSRDSGIPTRDMDKVVITWDDRCPVCHSLRYNLQYETENMR